VTDPGEAPRPAGDGPMSVSIVVPALDAEATIGDMLAGLASQAGVSCRREVIVVDGGSRDATADVVARFGVRLLVEPKRGPAAARNLGLREASGEIICHLDADTVPTRGWLREMLVPFSDPDVALVGGKTVSFPPETPAQRYMASSGRLDAVDYVRRPLFPFVPSRNMAVRREAALAIGGWADDLITAEDVDFCHRLLAAYPGPIVYRESAVLLHRNRATDDGLRKQAWGYGEGVAHLYERYPGETTWHWTDAGKVVGLLCGRAARAAVLETGARLRLTSSNAAELARYHWLWSWAFWRGFYSYRRTRAYR